MKIEETMELKTEKVNKSGAVRLTMKSENGWVISTVLTKSEVDELIKDLKKDSN